MTAGPHPRSPRVRRARAPARALALGLAIVAAGFALLVPASGAAAKPTPEAQRWDPRVSSLVDFVERNRGLRFDHSVPVHFLTGRTFDKAVTGNEGDLTKEDRTRLEQEAGTLRALGLVHVSGKKLFEQTNDLNAADVLAFYDPDKKEVVVKGTTLDVPTKVTVVHELTHVLQDQHFDLNKVTDQAAKHHHEDALTALVEGDATRIENKYVASLGSREQDQYYKEQDKQVAQSEGAIGSDVPAVLQVTSDAPYELGPAFVQALTAGSGHERLDRAFADPPVSDEQVVNPDRYLRRDRPASVPAPALDPGDHRLGRPDTLGAVDLYLVVASRLDPATALTAVNTWGGDTFVRFDRRGTSCLRAAVKGDRPADTTALAEVLGHWAANGPPGAASVARAGGLVVLTACDPGAEDRPVDEKVKEAGDVLGARAFLIGQALDARVPLRGAQCIGDRLGPDPGMRALLQVANPSDQQVEQFRTRFDAAVKACAV